MLTIGSLFSSIGGLEKGLEMAGLGPVLFQCEIDPFCRAVLAKHWPNVVRYEDVTRPREWPTVDLLCGGFPCTDVSSAGKRRGLGGDNSGLWYHFARVVRQTSPAWVVVENVASGAKKWLRPVRHQLHLFGYRTRALGIAASDCGAPHRRSRVFVLAYADRKGKSTGAIDAKVASTPSTISDVDTKRQRGLPSRAIEKEPSSSSSSKHAEWNRWPNAQPGMVRMADGISDELDSCRRRSLGNAVVPQCAQVVGEVIQEMMRASA